MPSLCRPSVCESRGLLHDGQLALHVEPLLAPLVADWLPRNASGAAGQSAPGAAAIRVLVARRGPAPTPDLPPTMRLMTASAWVNSERNGVSLRSEAGIEGSIDLTSATARLYVRLPDAAQELAHELFYMLTLTTAMLLVRRARTLLHAAAVVAPDGRAWLLVGDSHSGKTTTTANLVRAGWDYLSDDTVVLAQAERNLFVDGWLRPFHIDAGWAVGRVTGVRRSMDLTGLGPGSWRQAAPLGGLLFPQVNASAPTALAAITPAAALAKLIRQAPWLMADPGAAPPVLRMMERAVHGRVAHLSVGLDSYHDPARLTRALEPLFG